MAQAVDASVRRSLAEGFTPGLVEPFQRAQYKYFRDFRDVGAQCGENVSDTEIWLAL